VPKTLRVLTCFPSFPSSPLGVQGVVSTLPRSWPSCLRSVELLVGDGRESGRWLFAPLGWSIRRAGCDLRWGGLGHHPSTRSALRVKLRVGRAPRPWAQLACAACPLALPLLPFEHSASLLSPGGGAAWVCLGCFGLVRVPSSCSLASLALPPPTHHTCTVSLSCCCCAPSPRRPGLGASSFLFCSFSWG